MSKNEITAVGIDVSKGKSTVAVRRPGGEIVMMPFVVLHTAEDLAELTNTLRSIGGEIRVVMEHTGMYWRPIALALKEAGFFVSVVNAMLIHDFSDNSIRKIKTDRADSLKIANYALTFWQELRDYSVEDETRQMLKIQSRLYERTLNSSVALRNGLISLKEASEKWGVSVRQINYYCVGGRIPGAVKMAGVWLLPQNAEKPVDGRTKIAIVTLPPFPN